MHEKSEHGSIWFCIHFLHNKKACELSPKMTLILRKMSANFSSYLF